MEVDKKTKCHAIIHAASIASAGVSAATAQIPAADSVIIVPVQMAMIISLGKVYEYKITEGLAKSLISPLVVQGLGRKAAKSLVKLIPLAGNVVNAGVSASFTETLGWAVANEFAEGYKKRLNVIEVFRATNKILGMLA